MIKFSKKTLAILIIVVLSPVLVPLLFLAGSALMAGIYWSFGYYVNMPGWKMGQIAAEKESVEECELLRKTWYFGGFDSGDMHRSECIHTYASLTLDPLACELLLPSDYGWSCLGASSEKKPCLFDFKDPPEIRGNGIIAPMSQCINGDNIITNNTCCKIARIAFYEENTNCSSLDAPQNFIDQCHNELAVKLGDGKECKLIKNDNIRIGCEIRVKYKK